MNKYSRYAYRFNISKGYGTQHHAWASAPRARQVESAGLFHTFGRRYVEDRVDLDEARLVKMFGPVHRIESGNDDHLGVQQTARNNLRWMSEKYVGSFFLDSVQGAELPRVNP